MTPEEKAKRIDEDLKAADKARKDAEMAAGGNDGEMLDKCSAKLDELGKRLDAYDEEEKKKADAAKKDEDMPMDDEAEDREELRHAAGELPGDPKKLAADSRADSVQFSNGVRDMRNQIQYHADSAFRCWGENCPNPYSNEPISTYRRRIARQIQRHSPAWASVDLNTLSGQSLRNCCAQIFADSIAASTNPNSYDGSDYLREVQHTQRDGRVITEFMGRPSSWMRQFGGQPLKAKLNRYPDGQTYRDA
jgi:hypothetical protein